GASGRSKPPCYLSTPLPLRPVTSPALVEREPTQEASLAQYAGALRPSFAAQRAILEHAPATGANLGAGIDHARPRARGLKWPLGLRRAGEKTPASPARM